MKNEYIVKNGDVLGVKGEDTFKDVWFNFNGFDIRVLVTKEKEYYNFYIITDKFKQEPLNNLDIQEPLNIIDDLKENELLRVIEERAINFYLWNKYNRDFTIYSEPLLI